MQRFLIKVRIKDRIKILFIASNDYTFAKSKLWKWLEL